MHTFSAYKHVYERLHLVATKKRIFFRRRCKLVKNDGVACDVVGASEAVSVRQASDLQKVNPLAAAFDVKSVAVFFKVAFFRVRIVRRKAAKR